MAHLEPITLSTKRDVAIQRLRDAIVYGDFRFGDWLSENELAARFGISKTPIHDALHFLQREGLVEVLPQRGARVFVPTLETVSDVGELRILLEEAAIRAASKHNLQGFSAALKQTLHAMRQANESADVRSYLQLDMQFHNHAFDLCNSPALCGAFATISARSAAIRTQLTKIQTASREAGMAEHIAIVEHIGKGEIESAVALIRPHVERSVGMYRAELARIDREGSAEIRA